MTVKLYQMGRIDYEHALHVQRKLARLRSEEKISDVIVLAEHDHVFTIGRGGNRNEILIDEERLSSEGIKIFEIERGGSTTYHGPGQLVGYPIINLKALHCSPVDFLRKLEEVIMRSLKEFQIEAHVIEGRTGVWVGNAKIASIGIHVSRWITRHGFALNVSNALKYFDMIIPCGIPGCNYTSIVMQTGEKIEVNDVIPVLVKHFVAVFRVFIDDSPFAI